MITQQALEHLSDAEMTLAKAENGKTIIMINASALKESSCLLRMFLLVAEGHRQIRAFNDVEYGSAFHLFAKAYAETGNFLVAKKAAIDYFNNTPMEIKSKKTYLNENHLLATCLSYFTDVEPLDNFEVLKDEDGKPMVELKFAYPFYTDDEVEVLLVGTIDRIGKIKNGAYIIDDFKTTSVWDARAYFKGYLLSPQLLFYRLVIKKYAEAAPDGIFGKINSWNCGMRITGIFLGAPPKETKFLHSDVFQFKDSQLVEFEKLVTEKILNLVTYIKANKRPLKEGILNGACQTVYGACKFADACASPSPVVFSHVLHSQFCKRTYNPLNNYE